VTTKLKVRKISKDDYSKFLKKADEYEEMMFQSLASKKWNAAGLNAIHSGISANDALLIYHFGVRSISPRHDDAVKLLMNRLKRDDTEAMAKHIRYLISKKSMVEYDGRLLSKGEAEALVKHAKRFLD
jgi:hypothetical protein